MVDHGNNDKTAPAVTAGTSRAFARALASYAGRKGIVMLTLLLGVGRTEGIGLLMLIPMLQLIGLSGDGRADNAIVAAMTDSLATIGVPLTLPTLLTAYVALVSFRAVLVRRLPGPTLAEELEAGSLSGKDVIAAARRLGAAVGRLHAHGLRNRDLKLENLIRAPQDHTVSMVDLDGIRRKTALDRRGIGADLGRLLAAFRAAGSPGDMKTIGSFRRGYNAARKCLLVPRNHREDRHMWRLSAERAAAWASAHPRSD